MRKNYLTLLGNSIMPSVKPKKHLGQHFLTDKKTAQRIVNALRPEGNYHQVLEVGPGMGVLSNILLARRDFETWLIDIDEESVDYLKRHYPDFRNRIILGDFLDLDLSALFKDPIGIIGNFPYNISSQILFKVFEGRGHVNEVVGMFQREVASRCVAKPGTKTYGILSVFLQAYFDVEYLFTVKPGAFNPPPKVQSGVIRLTRNRVRSLDCDEQLFRTVVKTAFNQRRKTLRNALSGLITQPELKEYALLNLRAERLGVTDFVDLTNRIASQ